jgi:hypothetical protein
MANEQNLIPAKKGEVRNPNGRPKGIPNAATRYRRLLDVITKMPHPVTGKDEDFTQLEIMDMKIMQKALKGDIKAYEVIMDRLEGKATQPVDMNVALDPRKDILKKYTGGSDVRQTEETESRPSSDSA